MQYELIDEQAALVDYCQRIATAKVLAIDTEFVRTRTLIPKLGLIQVYDGEHLGLIDPVKLNDISCFTSLLNDPNIIKVLHSCSEDLDAFWTNLSITPYPVFDTQIAANILGMGQTLGYANLIEKLQGVVLDKGESRTDWIARPLSKQQLVYAAADVFYLLPAYHELYEQVLALNKIEWIVQEVAFLAEKKRTLQPTELAYLGIKNNWKLRAHSRLALKLMADWRLQKARQKDTAINFVLREQAMVEIAAKLPDHIAKLSSIEGLSPRDIREHGAILIDFVMQAKSADEAQCPNKIQRLIDFKEYKKALADLKVVCDDIAAEQSVPVEIIASKKQLNQWLKWCWFELDETQALGLKPDLISGWRKGLFANTLTSMFNTKTGKYHALRGI